MNTGAIKLLVDAMETIQEAASVPVYGDRIELDPKETKTLLRRYRNIVSSGGLKNELIIKTHGHIQNEKEKKEAFAREDDAKAKNAALIIFIAKEHCSVPMDREIGPIGEVCGLCGQLSESWFVAENHAENCEIRKLL